MLQAASRREAEAKGLKHYFTGKPCPHGHLAARYASTTHCVPCTIGRVVGWQRQNPAKHSAKNKRYYERNPEKGLEHSRRDHETARQKLNRERAEITGRPRPEVCDICAQPGTKIVFDHCHAHGHFRGWLCNRCNLLLGHVEDSPELLRKMAEYLEKAGSDGTRS